jgi:Ni2+-binding GTPase involved in maturation of urease and hydrogenase
MCLSPEDRTVYIEKLSQYVNPNIFKELFSGPTADVYMIMVYGAPRSGKTTLCKLLLNKWRTSKIGETRDIRRFGRDKYTKNTLINQVKKNILDRINIIVDGHCHTDELRAPFIELAEMHKVKYVVVEVNPGINMAYIFNHIAVEMAQSEDIVLYDTKDYYHYNSLVSRPPGVLLYCPEMQPIKQLLEFRY